MARHELHADVQRTSPPIPLAELGEPMVESIPDGPRIDDQLRLEAFMNEPVSIIVQESPDENAAQVVDVWVNGRICSFPRGVPVTTKRCYVEKLARSKSTTYKQPWMKQNNDAVSRHTSLDYPFSVIQDANPLGGAWLMKVLNEA